MSVPDFDRSVFVNCPFDADYRPLQDAVVFAIVECGFKARCALESVDSGKVRIDKIVEIIRECRFGIHDISRTELSPDTELPRFNMPFELGLFLGAARFGDKNQRRKVCLILDSEKYRYQKFFSDIAGQDPSAHKYQPAKAISLVRDFLSPYSPTSPLPGGAAVAERYRTFQEDLPKLCDDFKQIPAELTFADLRTIIEFWSSTSC
ncbi:MAG: hypothetical protein ACKV2Q_03935 [Planctomycetaceae bacterium]